ncbi:L-2-hydroxyglutarate oxidase [Georgenia subflava]|uniref:L-2-hydroxyglutarate oxidase n=1 Tax=Georgenia subflava TaxID=1622177 RepID=A0A6N7ERK1_9MICO|nr:L-2-hydroxyglutarate oxidase [Georgenia subflava]MPV39165.1 L-2-hydroxyglutarate oxidase [Georgenia subflava]
MTKVIVVGSGIVGLATAARLAARGDDVTVLEKERDLALHQTGRNSGVVHSGLYYPTGSLKARMGVAGAESMVAFARTHGVAVEQCGKLVVAVSDDELPGLHRLAERAVANGVPARLISAAEARDHEPHVSCVAALRVESTGIVDYRGVCEVLAEQVRAAGGAIRFGAEFLAARTEGTRVRARFTTSAGEEQLAADALVVCGGLHADRLARACGLEPEARIVPFRGEYFELTDAAVPLVQGLIYPVPDPRFPFLGVHLTKMVHGGVHAGPNAVLALAREGYRWRDVAPSDVADALRWPGLWELGRQNWRPGAREVARSVSKTLFARSLARLVPEIRREHLLRAPAGVRAQALRRDGSLVDDFLVQQAPGQVHVLNAPSPAATASLEIAAHLERQVDEALVTNR